MSLYRILALREDYPPGTCWAWMDGPEKVCGRPEGDDPHLCTRHAGIARRRAHAAVAKEAESKTRRDIASLAALPRRRAKLDRIDAEIARLDPPPPTDDVAAFGGVGSTAARRYQDRFTPDRIHRLAELHEARRTLAAQVAYAEGLQR